MAAENSAADLVPRMRQTPLRVPQREGQVHNEDELPPEALDQPRDA